MNDPSPNDPLSRIADGDLDAFAQWMAGAEPRIRASLSRFAAVVDVESVVQECLLRAWQGAGRVEARGRDDALLRHSIRVARNLAISEIRRRQVRPRGHAVAWEAVDEDVGEYCRPLEPDPHLRKRIAECREALPKKPAAALNARLEARGTRSDLELSDALGMKKNTFLQNVGRARRLLEACLEHHGVDLQRELA